MLPGRFFVLPDRCPHPDCRATDALIRWGTCERQALTCLQLCGIRVQRIRCQACGRTHSLLPDFLHPYRHYVTSLLQWVVHLYLLAGLGINRLMKRVVGRGPARSTALRAFAQSLDRNIYHVVYLSNPHLIVPSLYRQILLALQTEPEFGFRRFLPQF